MTEVARLESFADRLRLAEEAAEAGMREAIAEGRLVRGGEEILFDGEALAVYAPMADELLKEFGK
jgi:hypothetical protein